MSAPLPTSQPYLSIEGVSKHFGAKPSLGSKLATYLRGTQSDASVKAVSDIDLTIAQGEVVGLVGESGCGKSTLGRVVSGIHAPTSGRILLNGQPIMHGGRKTTTRVQMIFQDPFASLDPRMRIGETIAEGPLAHGLVKRADARAYVRTWLERVGLDPDFANRFPHQFSGGQRQRIAIARALAMQPDMLVCDEPVASLDVSIQAQIINLFLKLRREFNLTMLFISHDLGVVRHLCDRVAIMYLGRIVECARSDAIYDNPRHPYTRALLDSIPKLVTHDGADVLFKPIAGELPSPLNPPTGCPFHTRCPVAMPRCSEQRPTLIHHGAEHGVACFLEHDHDRSPSRTLAMA